MTSSFLYLHEKLHVIYMHNVSVHMLSTRHSRKVAENPCYAVSKRVRSRGRIQAKSINDSLHLRAKQNDKAENGSHSEAASNLWPRKCTARSLAVNAEGLSDACDSLAAAHTETLNRWIPQP